MDRDLMARCFNEWMRRFTDDPDAFSQTFASAKEYLDAEREGREPEYGEVCAAFMESIAADLGA